jgi:serine/threonine protein kinase
LDERREVGDYRLLSLLGRGGMAEVWAASRRGPSRFSKEVALKLIPAPNIETNTVMMFIDEAKAAAALDHPAIVRTFDLGRDRDVAFIAMELVRGPSLNALLAAKALLSPAIIAHIGERIASALDYAHRRASLDGRLLRLVHRDVSPQNVLIDAHGNVRLSDFGIARTAIQGHLSAAGTLRGKPGYMSPEQVRAQTLDVRSDLFSLGIVLHECVTLERLFGRRTVQASIASVLTHEPPLLSEEYPGFPEPLARIIEQLLAKETDERFQTAEDVVRAFEEVGRTLPGWASVTRDLEAVITDRFGPGAFDLDLTRLVDPPTWPSVQVIDQTWTSDQVEARPLVDPGFTTAQLSALLPPPTPRRFLPVVLAFLAVTLVSVVVAVYLLSNEPVRLEDRPIREMTSPRPRAIVETQVQAEVEPPRPIPAKRPLQKAKTNAREAVPPLAPRDREARAWTAIRTLEAGDPSRGKKLSTTFIEAKASGDAERLLRVIEEVEALTSDTH